MKVEVKEEELTQCTGICWVCPASGRLRVGHPRTLILCQAAAEVAQLRAEVEVARSTIADKVGELEELRKLWDEDRATLAETKAALEESKEALEQSVRSSHLSVCMNMHLTRIASTMSQQATHRYSYKVTMQPHGSAWGLR